MQELIKVENIEIGIDEGLKKNTVKKRHKFAPA